MAVSGFERMLSLPVPVHWQGWRTTTADLQQCGWELAVEYRVNRDEYALLLRHETMKLYALTNHIHLARGINFFNSGLFTPRDCELPHFTVVHVAPTFQVMTIHADLTLFKQIDARPQWIDSRIRDVEDFNIFALARSKAEEILVNKADMTVIEHLEAIKRLQEPKQHEIRQRMLKEGMSAPARETPKLQLVASIIHCEEQAA